MPRLLAVHLQKQVHICLLIADQDGIDGRGLYASLCIEIHSHMITCIDSCVKNVLNIFDVSVAFSTQF
jgi:hypothetical protein